MLDINEMLENIFEGTVDISDGETIDTTKTEDYDFEDTLGGVIKQSGDYDISDLSDREKCCCFDGICKESVVTVDGSKYRVSVSVTKIG